MKRKRFCEEQIILILKEREALGNVREACRQNNVTEQTLYRWHNKYEGMYIRGKTIKRLGEIEKP